MSETTNKMRDVAIYSDSLIRVRDLAADAIEAVEAQVAEAVARVAALEEMGRLGASPNGDDRTRGGMPPRGFDSPTPAAPTPPASAAIPASELRHRATQGFVSSTLLSDMWPHEPAPSAVPAPRGFKIGDRVRHAGYPNEEWTVCGLAMTGPTLWLRRADKTTLYTHREMLDLVRAADAPEAPAEDAGLVERLAEAIRNSTPGKPGTATSYLVPSITAILATLRAEGRLCAPGEVARLTAERDEAREFHELAEGDIRKWIDRYNERDKDVSDLRAKYLTLKARAEAADIRADGHAEGLRSIRKMLKQSPPDVDRAILWCDDSLSGYTQSVAATEAETNDRALAAEARAEAAEKELAEARVISAATAERVRTETQIATELRAELADANDRLTSQSRSIEEMHAEMVDLRAKLAAAEQALDDMRKSRDAAREERSKSEDARHRVEKELANANSDAHWAIAYLSGEKVPLFNDFLTRLSRALVERDRRHGFHDLNMRAATAEKERDALRAELDAERSGVATKLHDAGFNNVENLVGAYRFERAQADALRFSALTWFNEKGEPELLATAEEVTERRKAAAKELATLRAKPRFRTRRITREDAMEFMRHDGSAFASLRALGFRRRVDGAK